MENKRTCLYDRHVKQGALISPFGGFDMPIQYSTIIEEHQAVRQHCGVFDVSHMGEVTVEGPDAERWVNRSEEHTSELQSRQYLVCRLLLEQKSQRQSHHSP